MRLAVGGDVAIVVDESMIRAVDLATGAVSWTMGDDEPVRAEQPIVSGDLVYLNVEPRQLVALSTSDGSEVLRIDEAFEVNSQNANRAFTTAPVAFVDLVLVIDQAGDLVAYR